MDSANQKRAVTFIRARHLGSSGRHPAIEAMQVEAQGDACKKLAEQLGAAVVDEYVEYGGTGKIAHRPVLMRLLDRLRTDPTIDYLIVASLDRLARSRADWAAIRLELEAANVTLIMADAAQSFKDATEAMYGLAGPYDDGRVVRA
ncbi:MAG: recombinase family protein [Streptosporangiaceae bacterium]|nr:recombinase family protein [Streptosporangiaceae bacterium]